MKIAGRCHVCGELSTQKSGRYTYLCAKHYLLMKEEERLEIVQIVNQPGIQWKIRRALLREKFGFAEILIDELVGKTEPASDY